jgi:hypothetical protein
VKPVDACKFDVIIVVFEVSISWKVVSKSNLLTGQQRDVP